MLDYLGHTSPILTHSIIRRREGAWRDGSVGKVIYKHKDLSSVFAEPTSKK